MSSYKQMDAKVAMDQLILMKFAMMETMQMEMDAKVTVF